MAAIDQKYAPIRVMRRPKGIRVKDRRFKQIPEFWVEHYSTGKTIMGSICIQVKADRWIIFHYYSEK